MTAKRRKNRRKELDNEIQSFFQKGSTSAIESRADKDLFSVDTIGSNSVDPDPGQTPLIRQLPKVKKLKTGGIAKRKLKSKSARQKQKLDHVFDIWETTQKLKGVPKLGRGERPHLPAIPVDHPGCSWNPDPVLHEQALEKKQMEESRTKSRVDMKKENPVKEELTSEPTVIDENPEHQGIVYRPKIPDRKTRAQRNKEMRHKLFLKSIEEKKELKKLNAQINNIHAINKEITKELEQKHKNNKLRKAKTIKKLKRGIKKIGKKVIKGTKTRVLETDQLVSALRQLNVSNDLALDRYVHLQKRGLVDTGRFRGRRNKPKYKYIHPGPKARRLEEAKVSNLAMQKRVQALHNQLEKMKMNEKKV